ncbi:MAG: hypothetical protein L6R42_001338 [Xanthoria sp. 1 TBL-2021]|nr:MAG: hypothetical protein L6R42_001338 [Xanthoria sp. 1 TBL-2021]
MTAKMDTCPTVPSRLPTAAPPKDALPKGNPSPAPLRLVSPKAKAPRMIPPALQSSSRFCVLLAKMRQLRSCHSISSRPHMRAVMPTPRKAVPPKLPMAADDRRRVVHGRGPARLGRRRMVVIAVRANGEARPRMAPAVKPRWRQWRVSMV